MTAAIVSLSLTALLLAIALAVSVLAARGAALELEQQRTAHEDERERLRVTAEHARYVDQRAREAVADAWTLEREQLLGEVAELRAELDADGYRALVGRRVTANVRDGGAISGVLTHVYADAIVIGHPAFVGRSRPADIGSEVTLARASVPMLQRFATDDVDAGDVAGAA